MFRGTKTDLLAFVVANKARSMLENYHAGQTAEPEDPVTWPGGIAFYKDVAKISMGRIFVMREEMVAYATESYGIFSKSSSHYTREEQNRAAFTIMMTGKWDLPDLSPIPSEQRERLEDALRHPNHAEASPARAFGVLVGMDGFIPSFFMEATQGEKKHLAALRKGEDVWVHTRHGKLPWHDVSHMSDEETKAFNKGFSSRVAKLVGLAQNVAEIRRTPYQGLFQPHNADVLGVTRADMDQERPQPQNRLVLHIQIPHTDRRTKGTKNTKDAQR